MTAPDSVTPEETELQELNETQGSKVEIKEVPEEERDLFDVPEELAILPLRGVVLYPLTALPLTVGQPRSTRLVDDAVLMGMVEGLSGLDAEPCDTAEILLDVCCRDGREDRLRLALCVGRGKSE